LSIDGLVRAGSQEKKKEKGTREREKGRERGKLRLSEKVLAGIEIETSIVK
jgi:hypothetical protein